MELETFGEPACESEVTRLDGHYSKYYFHHTEFTNLATDPRSYLFIGRRGSGKTALTQYFYFQKKLPRAINIDIDEPAAFQGVLDKIAARTVYAREIAIRIWPNSGALCSGSYCFASCGIVIPGSERHAYSATKPAV